jgi:hypothetical protein
VQLLAFQKFWKILRGRATFIAETFYFLSHSFSKTVSYFSFPQS